MRLAAKLVIVIAFATLISGLSLHQVASQGNRRVDLALGVEFNAHSTPVWVALRQGIFAKQGLNITTLFKFRTGVELAAALARGEIDAAWACLGPILNLLDRGINVKIIVKVHNYGYALVVDPSRINSVADLNSTVVYSTGGLVSPTTLMLLRLQDLYGVKFEIRPVQDPQVALSMLISGYAVAVALPEHFASVAEERGMRVLLRAQDVWPGMPGSYLVVRSDVLEKRPSVVRALVEVSREALMTVTADRVLAAALASEELGVSLNTAIKSISAIEWIPSASVEVQEVQEYIDYMYERGLLERRLNATEVIATVR